MTVFTKTAVDVFAAQDASGAARKVSNHDVQVWGTEVERAIKSFQAGGGVVFDSKTEADGSLDYNAYTMAWVFDVDPSLAGIYQKQGASGSGSWQRVGDLPYSFILATNTNSGNPDAIEATTAIPIPAADGGALIALPIVADNTASPVTVSFNGGPALTVKTIAGNDVPASALASGMIVWGFKQGDEFRLVTDLSSAGILAGAEAAAEAAEDAANRAQSYSAMLSADKIKFATVADLLADETMSYTPGSGLIEVGPGDIIEAQGFRYEVLASGATDAHIETAGGVKLRVVGSPLNAQAFPGANAGEQIRAAVIALPETGGTVDATGYIGTQLIASDIFADIDKPFVLLLGAATFEADLSSYSISLWSHQKVVLNGTILRPTVEGSDGWTSATGFFVSRMKSTTGSISAAGNILTVADPSIFEVGQLVAIDGAQGVDTNEQQALTASISDTDTTIPIADATNIPATYTFVIGDEIITGTEKSGNSLINVTRGAYGTTPTSHLNGTLASLSPYHRAVVTSIDGSDVTISHPAAKSVVGARVFVGAVEPAVEGQGTLDGRQRRDLPDPANGNLLGVVFQLARLARIADGIIMRNWDHGGFMLISSWDCYVGGSCLGNSRPSDNLGANAWVFRNSCRNTIRLTDILDSHIGIFVDDRTSSASLWDGPCDDNYLDLGYISLASRGVQISGGSGNTVYIGGVRSEGGAIVVAANEQGTTPRPTQRNTVMVGSVVGFVAVRDADNFVSVGRSDDIIDVGNSSSRIRVERGDSAGDWFGNGIASPMIETVGLQDIRYRLRSVQTSRTQDDLLGSFEVFGTDASGPGPGIKGAMKVEAAGGTGAGGQITFATSNGSVNEFDAVRLTATGHWWPLNAGQNLGGSSNRWDNVYLENSPNVSSDERGKIDIRDIDEAERRVAVKLKSELKAFRRLASVEKKGDAARIHFGVVAQRVRDVFSAEGLDAERYSFFCVDHDDAGNEHLSIRYEQLLAFIVSALP